MGESAEREPTIEEIVVALRETRLPGRAGGMTVIGGNFGEARTSQNAAQNAGPNGARFEPRPARPAPGQEDWAVSFGDGAPPDLAALRDAEIQRLLGENARLNERVIFLIKVIEREQALRTAERSAGGLAAEERAGIVREVRAALEAELRPVLLTLVRLLERQRPGGVPPGRPNGGAAVRPDSAYDARWIPDLIRAMSGEAAPAGPADPVRPRIEPAAAPQRSGRFARLFGRLGSGRGPRP